MSLQQATSWCCNEVELEVAKRTIRELVADRQKSIKVEAKKLAADMTASLEEGVADQLTELENKNEQLEGDLVDAHTELEAAKAMVLGLEGVQVELEEARATIVEQEQKHTRLLKRKDCYKHAFRTASPGALSPAKRQHIE